MAVAHLPPNLALPSVPTDGTPLLIGTSSTPVHVPPSTSNPDDIVLTLVNVTGSDVTGTIAYGGVSLALTVPAGGSLVIGPWTIIGGNTLAVTAGSANAIYALMSIRR